MSVFAIVALILATIGVHGLIAFMVARRTREIGIRKAVGARNEQIVGAVFGRGIIIALAGLAVGLAATAVLSRTIDGLLFNIPRHDPLTLATVGLVLLLACAAALVVPARRAARVDAAHALHVE
jgi:ABC-type antimicrobial peptide transport system permease subunit